MAIDQTGESQELSSRRSGTSRRALLRGAAIGGVGLALGGLKAVPALADTTTDTSAPAGESLQTIINIAVTAEYLAVTFYGYGLANFTTLKLEDGMGVNRAYLKAAQAEEQDHISILELLGAQAITKTFSMPSPAMFTDNKTFTSTLETLETAFVAAYLAATYEAAAAGRPDVAQLTARHAAVEAEHRVNARNIINEQPSNNSSFEKLLFPNVTAAATALTNLGFLSPVPGNSYAYPGPVAIDFTGVIDRHP